MIRSSLFPESPDPDYLAALESYYASQRRHQADAIARVCREGLARDAVAYDPASDFENLPDHPANDPWNW